jgi:Cd2+/Zn2+-exporting ATPase
MATRSFPIKLVLPDLPDAQDACVQRLTALTQQQPGVSLAHPTGDGELCVHFDPSRTTVAQMRKLVTAAGARLSAEYGHVSIAFGGLPGEDAGRRLEDMLRKQAGVLEVSANVAAGRVRVEFERSKTDADTLRRLVEEARFPLEPMGPSVPAPSLMRFLTGNRELVWSLAAAVLLGLGWASERFWAWPDRVTIPLYLAAYAFGAWDLVSHTVASWRKGAFTFDIDLLMLLAALGAAGLSEWAEGAFLLTLFALAHALEH